jgi:hypothetical protein
MTNNIDDTFDDPENLEAMFRNAGEGDSLKQWKRELEDGRHPSPQILIDYANKKLGKMARIVWFEHISHCPRCSKEVYSIREKSRRLEKLNGRTSRQTNDWKQRLIEIESSNKVCFGLLNRDFLREIDSKESLGPNTTKPQSVFEASSTSFEELSFKPGNTVALKIVVPKDSYLIAFTYTNPDSIRLIFPASKEDDLLISSGIGKKLVLSPPSRSDTFFLKVICTSQKILDPSSLNFKAPIAPGKLRVLVNDLSRLSDEDLATGICKITIQETKAGMPR